MVGDLVAGKRWRGEQVVEGVPGNEGHIDDGVILGFPDGKVGGFDASNLCCVSRAEEGKTYLLTLENASVLMLLRDCDVERSGELFAGGLRLYTSGRRHRGLSS